MQWNRILILFIAFFMTGSVWPMYRSAAMRLGQQAGQAGRRFYTANPNVAGEMQGAMSKGQQAAAKRMRTLERKKIIEEIDALNIPVKQKQALYNNLTKAGEHIPDAPRYTLMESALNAKPSTISGYNGGQGLRSAGETIATQNAPKSFFSPKTNRRLVAGGLIGITGADYALEQAQEERVRAEEREEEQRIQEEKLEMKDKQDLERMRQEGHREKQRMIAHDSAQKAQRVQDLNRDKQTMQRYEHNVDRNKQAIAQYEQHLKQDRQAVRLYERIIAIETQGVALQNEENKLGADLEKLAKQSKAAGFAIPKLQQELAYLNNKKNNDSNDIKRKQEINSSMQEFINLKQTEKDIQSKAAMVQQRMRDNKRELIALRNEVSSPTSKGNEDRSNKSWFSFR